MSVTRIFIDTSILRGESFADPDFNKLLERSRSGKLRVVVSHIAWEERRNQFLDHLYKPLRAVRESFEELNLKRSNSFVFGGLGPAALSLWTDEELEAQSKEAMEKFAADNKIHVLAITHNHAQRAWESYFRFGASPPFSSERGKKRREDIPDSWIYEAAADLMADGLGLVALCRDDNLTEALKKLGIEVFTSYADVVARIEGAEMEAQAAVPAPAPGPAPASVPASLDGILSAADDQFRSLERRLLGFVAYLETPTKDQVFGLIGRDKVTIEMVQNAAQRLVIKGLLRDTGHRFLVPDVDIAKQMRDAAEPEIIELLKS